MMHDEKIKVDVKKFWVKNFKSLKDFELDLEKVNVLVGKNGSGKTNVIEALKLLKMIVNYFKGIEVNPFLEWWGYDNTVWKKDVNLNVSIGFEYEVKVHKSHLLEPNVRARYEIVSTGIGGEFNILKEKIVIPDVIELVKTQSSIEIIVKKIKNNICDKIGHDISHSDSKRKYIKLDHFLLGSLSISIDSIYGPFKNTIEKNKFKEELTNEIKSFCKLILKLIQEKLKTRLYDLFLLEQAIYDYKITFYDIDNYIEILDIDITDYLEAAIRNKIYDLLKEGILRSQFPLLHKLFDYATTKEPKINIHTLTGLIAYQPIALLRDKMKLITSAIIGAYIIANKSTILKKLDYKSVKEPAKLKKENILTEDGSNLTAVLYSMGKGRIPERIDLAVKYAFGENCKIGIEPTSDGR
ncbi:MAG: AAA family ATPase, partial [Candidatus Asgardarchaeia archaeon]